MAQTSPFFKLVSTFNCTKQLLAFSIPFLTILVAINIVRSVQKKYPVQTPNVTTLTILGGKYRLLSYVENHVKQSIRFLK